MHSVVLNQIEEMTRRLSRKEQLCSLRSPTPSAYGTTLIEQLAHCLREGSIKNDISKQTAFKSQIVAMAADPEVQAELQKIDHEFGVTEADGLEFE